MEGTAPATRILIADDHPLVRGALRRTLEGALPGLVTAEAGTFEEALAALAAAPGTDLLLLDLAMPGSAGFPGLAALRAAHPSVPVIVVSATADPATVRRALDCGAAGFVPKTADAETLRGAVRAVLAGGGYSPPDADLAPPPDAETRALLAKLANLTPQQARVLMMLNQGLLNKQIAHELGVSEATVKAHVSAILTKLGVESRTQAVIAVAKLDALPRGEDAAAAGE